MDAELKAKWVKALRSGEYEQARKVMHNRHNAYCCLGVLCRVAGATFDGLGFRIGSATVSDNATLSDDGCQRLGLSNEAHDALTDLNDSGKSFPAIADYIEVNL